MNYLEKIEMLESKIEQVKPYTIFGIENVIKELRNEIKEKGCRAWIETTTMTLEVEFPIEVFCGQRMKYEEFVVHDNCNKCKELIKRLDAISQQNETENKK